MAGTSPASSRTTTRAAVNDGRARRGQTLPMRGVSILVGWTLVVLGSILMISPIPFGFIIIGAGSAILASARRPKPARR